MKKSWIVAAGTATLIVGLFALLNGAGTDSAQEKVANMDPANTPAKVSTVASRQAPTTEKLREPAETSDPVPDKSKPEFDQEPVLVKPYRLRIHAVDIDRHSVPEAKVVVWDAKKVRNRLSAAMRKRTKWDRPYAYSGRKLDSKPVIKGTTDDTGRCTLELDRENVYLFVRKKGVGDSGDINLWHSRVRDGKEQTITLYAKILLKGLVLRENGLPAKGVNVRVAVTGSSTLLRGRPRRSVLPPTKTDHEGRFTVPLERYCSYVVRVNDGKQQAFPERVYARTPGDKTVVIRFPGAISIRGFLLDASGMPVEEGQSGFGRRSIGKSARGMRTTLFV